MQKRLTYEPALDGLRAIAVFAVMIFHAYPGVLPGGWAGVDIFFVLSGYLITRLLQDEVENSGELNLIRFYIRRALRLMPALWTLLLFVLVLILFSRHREEIAKAWVMAATYLMNWNRAFGIWPEWYLGHTWSLAAEEQFYLLWPMAFLLVRDRRPLLFIGAGILGVMVLRLLLRLDGANAIRIYNGFGTHADTLLIGCGLAFVTIPESVRAFLARAWFVWAAAIGVVFFTLPWNSKGALTIGLPMIGLAAAALVVASRHGVLHRILGWRPAVFTGRISYALYLWHFPLLNLARVRMPGISPILPLVAAYAVAVISYFTVEAYFRKLKARLAMPADVMAQSAMAERA